MAVTAAQVETAIQAILSGGQSVTLDGVSMTQASLPALQAQLEKLNQATSRAAGGSRPTFRAFNFSGMGYE